MQEAIEEARSEAWMPADAHYDHVLDRYTRDQHGKILEAIKTGDADTAARRMGEHIDTTLATLERVAHAREDTVPPVV